MTLCDAVKDFGPKVTENYRDTRFCGFAPPDETVGVIDVSPSGDGSRGIAFLTDRMIVKLDGDARQIAYRDIRVMETLPSYETPFEDELMIASPAGDIRISDCSLNKFFLRQLISNVSRLSARMRDVEREALNEKLTSDALDYYAQQLFSGEEKQTIPAPEKPVRVEAAAAVQEIAAAKKAALAEAQTHDLDIPEEPIEWLSAPHIPHSGSEKKDVQEPGPQEAVRADDIDVSRLSHEETMNFLADSIAEINAPAETPEPASPAEPEPTEPLSAVKTAEIVPQTVPAEPQIIPAATPQTEQTVPPAQPIQPEKPAVPHMTAEPDSPDIYIQASRKIRELIADGRLTMEQVDKAVREQLVPASEIYSALDVENAALPPAVKKRALQLNEAADHLPEYFTLGEDIAARVMFFMLYQMLSYTDRILQTDVSKQKLNYFFVKSGAAGIVLSMLDAGN